MPAETNISKQEFAGGGADAGMGAGGAAGIAGDERIVDRSGVRRGSLENILPGMVASTKSKLETSTSPKNEDAPTNFPDTPQSAERRASGTRFAVPPVPDNKAPADTSTKFSKTYSRLRLNVCKYTRALTFQNF
jgi:hypothetical protein